MDEGTISVETAFKLANDMTGSAKEDLLKFLQNAQTETIKFADIAKSKMGPDVANALKKAFEQAQELINSFFTLTDVGKNLKDSVGDFGVSAIDAFRNSNVSVSSGIMAMLDYSGVIDKNITGMGDLGKAGYEAGSRITTAFTSISPIIKAAFKDDGVFNFTNAVIEGTSRVIGLQRELIGMSLAQGRVADVTDTANHRFKDMNESYLDYVNMSIKVAHETGQTAGSAMELIKALSSIPGSLDSGGEAVKASKLATAAGMEQLVMAKQLADMYTRLGTNEKDATENMAYMHEKAGNSKLRMQSFNDTVLSIAGSFKLLGDNTVSTTNFVKAFDDAFRDSQISPEAMKQVITSIGDGIQHMDVAKRAFVSSSTGGPGGLAGAMQMDYAIQEGRVDEVIRKTMQAMQNQFGGQPVTLKDAVENPALAGELYKQVQYLTQVAGIAKDDKEAYRVLEAMKSGVMDKLVPGAGEGEKGTALERQLGKGASLQEQTKTELMGIHQTLEATRLLTDQNYHEIFEMIDDNLGSIRERLGARPIGNEQREAVTAGVRALAHNKPGEAGTSQYSKPEFDEMIGGSLGIEGMVGNMDNDVHKFFSNIRNKLTTKKPKEAEVKPPIASPAPQEGTVSALHQARATQYREVMAANVGRNRPPPGTEAGISEISRGQLPKVGTMPELQKLTLPSLNESDRDTALPSIAHTFEPATVNLVLDTGDQKKLLHTIQLQIQEDNSKRNMQAATGRR